MNLGDHENNGNEGRKDGKKERRKHKNKGT